MLRSPTWCNASGCWTCVHQWLLVYPNSWMGFLECRCVTVSKHLPTKLWVKQAYLLKATAIFFPATGWPQLLATSVRYECANTSFLRSLGNRCALKIVYSQSFVAKTSALTRCVPSNLSGKDTWRIGTDYGKNEQEGLLVKWRGWWILGVRQCWW